MNSMPLLALSIGKKINIHVSVGVPLLQGTYLPEGDIVCIFSCCIEEILFVDIIRIVSCIIWMALFNL